MKNLEKAIYYYTLASDQNFLEAHIALGKFYYNGEYVEKNINKAIYYFSLAANQNSPEAQCILGILHKDDINKAIHYFTLAASQNMPEAQYYLSSIYLSDLFIKQNLKKGIFLLTKSAENNNIKAHFSLGFLIHEGKFVKQDIEIAIKHYKYASSFYMQYAKNNIGIIYKHGFGDKIPKNIDFAEIYFNEAIKQKNDKVSMYNLAHMYIFEKEKEEKYINKTIELLIKSSNQGFSSSNDLLCYILILKHGNKIDEIQNDLLKYTNSIKGFLFLIEQKIKDNWHTKSKLELVKNQYKNIDFLYDNFMNKILSNSISTQKSIQTSYDQNELYDLTQDFYEGFGQDISLM